MRFSDSKEAGGNCSQCSTGMEATVNAPLVSIAGVVLYQLFSRSTSGTGRESMSFRLCSGERSASAAAGWVGFLLGFNFVERRVLAISEEGDDCEDNIRKEADVKPSTVREALVRLLTTSMFLGFGHVQPYQIGTNNPPKQVLTMKRLGGDSAVAQVVPDIPLKLFEANGTKLTKLQVWEKIWPNNGACGKMVKLMEEEIGTATKFLQSKVLCKMPASLATSSELSALKPPEPNAPL